MRVHFLFLIYIMGLCSLSVSAQDESDANGRELRLLAWAPTEIPLSLGSGKKALTLALSTDQFTLIKGKQLPGGNTVEIFAEVPDPKAQALKNQANPTPPAGPEVPQAPPTGGAALTGPTRKILYATGSWPPGSRHAIGFLAPDGNGPIPKGKIVLLPDSPELHPEHTMRAINLTEITLGIRLGEKKERVPVQGDLISPFDPGRLRIDIAVDKNEKWSVVTGSYLATARHYRCFALIRPQVNPNPEFPSNQPDIQNIFEQTSPLPTRPPLPLPAPKAP
jgi:hypothetical protein